MSPLTFPEYSPENDNFIIAVNLEERGAIALMSEIGFLAGVKLMPNLKWDQFFARDGVLTDFTHLVPNIHSVKRIVISLPSDPTKTPSELRIGSRTSYGLLIHLFDWLELPVIVVDRAWVDTFKARHPGRTARSIMREFPTEIGFEAAYDSELLAETAMLAFVAASNEKWTGINLRRGTMAPPPVNPRSTLH